VVPSTSWFARDAGTETARSAGEGRRADHIDRRGIGLRSRAFPVQDLLVRTCGDDSAVVIGTHVVEGPHRGNPGQTRATMVFVGSRLASTQTAFGADTAGAPSVPGRPR
jgi:hypothetical protein